MSRVVAGVWRPSSPEAAAHIEMRARPSTRPATERMEGSAWCSIMLASDRSHTSHSPAAGIDRRGRDPAAQTFITSKKNTILDGKVKNVVLRDSIPDSKSGLHLYEYSHFFLWLLN